MSLRPTKARTRLVIAAAKIRNLPVTRENVTELPVTRENVAEVKQGLKEALAKEWDCDPEDVVVGPILGGGEKLCATPASEASESPRASERERVKP